MRFRSGRKAKVRVIVHALRRRKLDPDIGELLLDFMLRTRSPEQILELRVPALASAAHQLVEAELDLGDHVEATELLDPRPFEAARDDRARAVLLDIEERVGDRERFPEERVGHAEHRGIGADRERHCRCRGERRSGAFSQHSDGKTQILG